MGDRDPVSEGAKQKYREALSTPVNMLQTMIVTDSGFYVLILEDIK